MLTLSFESLIWRIRNNELISAWRSARILVKYTGSSFVLRRTLLYQEMVHWPSYQQLRCLFTHETAAFAHLKFLFWLIFSCLWRYTQMASSACVCLEISTFGASRCTRPTLTLIYLIYNMPLSIWSTFFGSVNQKFWQKTAKTRFLAEYLRNVSSSHLRA